MDDLLRIKGKTYKRIVVPDARTACKRCFFGRDDLRRCIFPEDISDTEQTACYLNETCYAFKNVTLTEILKKL